jgi:phenylacetate-CoA ligase
MRDEKMFAKKDIEKIGSKDMEYAPVGDIIKFQEKLLMESDFLKNVYKSKLYHKKWKKQKIDIREIRSIADLNRLPYLTPDDIKKLYSKSINKIAFCTPQTWFYDKENKNKIWIPYSSRDIRILLRLIDRVFRVAGIKDDDIILNVAYSAPSLGDMLPYLMAYSQIMKGKNGVKAEIISVSLDLLESGVNRLDFTERRKPTMLMMKPSAALKIRKYLKKPLDKLRIAIFYGENFEKYRKKILNYYKNLEVYESYTNIENISFNMECNAHKGIHIWLDICIPEIISVEELEKEKADLSYKPKAVNIYDAKEGTTGELVLTIFRESLPLVRYRTGDIVKVVSNKKCKCGRTHPRIKLIKN